MGLSLKQTPPERRSDYDLGETNLSTPKAGHRANKHNAVHLPWNQNHGAKFSDSVL